MERGIDRNNRKGNNNTRASLPSHSYVANGNSGVKKINYL